MLIDTHTHLFAEEFKADSGDMLQRAKDVGVSKFILPNIDSSSVDAMIKLEEEFPEHCYATIGLHPCSVKEDYEKELTVVERWLEQRPFYAIGEIGMDYYWDKTYIDQQKQALSVQIGWAKKYSLPIIIHQRECFDDLFDIIQSLNDDKLRGVFHCFTGTSEQAQRILSLGNFLLGIGGVLTYKTSTLPDVLQHIDLKHLVLETDSPYLSPVPYRGKRNESSYLPLIANKLAEIKKTSLDEVAEITTLNAKRMFAI